MFVCCECCVLSGRGNCDDPIPRPEWSYRLWCVVLCDLEISSMRRHHGPPWEAAWQGKIYFSCCNYKRSKTFSLQFVIWIFCCRVTGTPSLTAMCRYLKPSRYSAVWEYTTLRCTKTPVSVEEPLWGGISQRKMWSIIGLEYGRSCHDLPRSNKTPEPCSIKCCPFWHTQTAQRWRCLRAHLVQGDWFLPGSPQ